MRFADYTGVGGLRFQEIRCLSRRAGTLFYLPAYPTAPKPQPRGELGGHDGGLHLTGVGRMLHRVQS
jgi:hypothetical protein